MKTRPGLLLAYIIGEVSITNISEHSFLCIPPVGKQNVEFLLQTMHFKLSVYSTKQCSA